MPPKTRLIELPDNEGTTGSINRAVQETASQYILLLNNDVELEPDYLEKLVCSLDADAKLAFVTGKLLRAADHTQLDGAGDAMLMAGAAYRLGHLDADHGQFDSPVPVLSGCGAAVLYRRDVFEAAGLLDENFFAYLDDLDLALRAQLLGYSGLYRPDAVAYHVGSATLGQTLHPRVIEYLTRNQIFLLLKNYPGAVLLRMLPRIVVYQGAWFLFAAKRGGLSAWFRGMFQALAGVGKMRRLHADLMAKRRIDNRQLLALLRESERQIYRWQQSLPAERKSGLVRAYFGIFGKP